MRVLYVASGHPLQEADDCLMWQYLGYKWFSTGYYSVSDSPGDLPFINNQNISVKKDFDRVKSITHAHDAPNTINGRKNKEWTGSQIKNIFFFTKEFIDNFDVVIFNHFIDNYFNNKHLLKDKICIFKTYGMHEIKNEKFILQAQKEGVKIVRNSPIELKRSKITHDEIIRGCIVKDENDISGWVGNMKKTVTFCSNFHYDETSAKKRKLYYTSVCDKSNFPFELYGSGVNFISHEKKIDILKKSRVNLVIGTPNSNNTYSFVESWVMGMPTVVFGRKLWQSYDIEPEHLIKNGVNGYVSNNINEISDIIDTLNKNYDLAKKIGDQGREDALTIYSRKILANKWKNLISA